ncbi:hypothetical protein [Polynucleobacter necessarius]|uniref:hypothetical protein n=1 Tax=Polynucleobacter necessarius TaxID=576610 RepID=UPI000E09D1C1|nr:hypothetical protein [Polynucleobacter necessarius]
MLTNLSEQSELLLDYQPGFLDHLSDQLTNENGEHQAIELLFEAYPFKRASYSQRIELINRLILLLKNNPDNIPVAYLEKLITPLDTPELRTLQVTGQAYGIAIEIMYRE